MISAFIIQAYENRCIKITEIATTLSKNLRVKSLLHEPLKLFFKIKARNCTKLLLAEPHIFGAPSRDQITFARYELTLFAGYLTDGPLAEKRVCSVLKREGVYRFFRIVIEFIC